MITFAKPKTQDGTGFG